jgi:hypothetical protein
MHISVLFGLLFQVDHLNSFVLPLPCVSKLNYSKILTLSMSTIPNAQLTEANRRLPLIVDDSLRVPLDHFLIPAHYADTLDYLLVSHGTIVDRVEKLAFDISQDYQGQTLHLLCVLKGGSAFFADLCSAIRKFHDYKRQTYIPFTFDFVK